MKLVVQKVDQATQYCRLTLCNEMSYAESRSSDTILSLDLLSAQPIWRDIDTNLTPIDKTYTINTTNTNDTTTTITIVNERGAFLDIIDLITSNSKVPFFEEKNIYFQNFKCHYLKMSFCRLGYFLLHEPHI